MVFACASVAFEGFLRQVEFFFCQVVSCHQRFILSGRRSVQGRFVITEGHQPVADELSGINSLMDKRKFQKCFLRRVGRGECKEGEGRFDGKAAAFHHPVGHGLTHVFLPCAHIVAFPVLFCSRVDRCAAGIGIR